MGQLLSFRIVGWVFPLASLANAQMLSSWFTLNYSVSLRIKPTGSGSTETSDACFLTVKLYSTLTSTLLGIFLLWKGCCTTSSVQVIWSRHWMELHCRYNKAFSICLGCEGPGRSIDLQWSGDKNSLETATSIWTPRGISHTVVPLKLKTFIKTYFHVFFAAVYIKFTLLSCLSWLNYFQKKKCLALWSSATWTHYI